MKNSKATSTPRWLVPEVVQTSAMDCGPASLKCLLEGFHIPVSYGRLREACQTDIDGTSIDMIETVANQLGVVAEQVMLPIDHLFLPSNTVLPAMVVVKHADGAHHFVVIWRQFGNWLQVMDPAVGRRWLSCKRFAEEIYRHELVVQVEDWFAWAQTEEFQRPLRQRLQQLGASKPKQIQILQAVLQEQNWLLLAKLDACVRLTQSVLNAGGVSSGKSALKLLQAFAALNAESPQELLSVIPAAYWSVLPIKATDDGIPQLLLKGAVLLQVKAKTVPTITEQSCAAPLSIELSAALNEKPQQPLTVLFNLLKNDGIWSPVILCWVVVISVGAIAFETLLFRGIFDIASELNLANQRFAAMLGLIIFVALLILIELPINMESMRLGRHVETRLRIALLKKLPLLSDRYFQSRPISDMAERSHSINQIRSMLSLGIQFVQALWDILFTLVGICLLDLQSLALAVLITSLAIVLPLLFQPLVNERDLRVRNHSGALFRFYLDALLGLVPVRTHGAEQAVGREHEGLLVEWIASSRGLIVFTSLSGVVQSLICMSLVGLLLFQHFIRTGSVLGGDLLLVFWALKLPSIGQKLTNLAHQYPAQRNMLLRLLEPLTAPEEIVSTPNIDVNRTLAMALSIVNGNVVAAGNSILRNINLNIAPGEHIAIVGASGAGKSTLIGLILGWHRLAAGELVVDGHVQLPNLQALRHQIAWVDPAIQLWNDSFINNLNYSTDGEGFESIREVIDSADLTEILQKLPDGMQTYLGEGGALLSGGEGQRVRLGRALLQTDVRLVLLDEPFRGMERAQRKQLLVESRQWWQQSTLLCVTHDVQETLSFNRVLVIDDGCIVEDGCPAELAKQSSRYSDLLLAEQKVREQMWQGKLWRKLYFCNGTIEGRGSANG
jgi:ATP-binding cassette subfamily B protein